MKLYRQMTRQEYAEAVEEVRKDIEKLDEIKFHLMKELEALESAFSRVEPWAEERRVRQ